MSSRIDKLNAKIEKLLQEKQKIEETCMQALFKIVSDAVIKKRIDVPILAGLLLDVGGIVKESPNKVGGWQMAGEKFLQKGHNAASAKTETTAHSVCSTIETTFTS